MLHTLRLRVLGLLILGACVLALPAMASGAERWQRVADPAPGGTNNEDGSFVLPSTKAAVSGDTAYLLVSTPDRFTVYRARARDAQWRQFAVLRKDPAERTAVAMLAVADKTVWLAWYDQRADGLWYLHIATSSGGAFREVRNPFGGAGFSSPTPITSVTYRGELYLASPAGVARFSKNGRRVERVDTGLSRDGGAAWLVEMGNRLYVVQATNTGTVASRLNRRGNAWETVGSTDAGSPSDVAAGGGAIYIVIDNGPGELLRLIPGGTFETVPGPDWAIRQVSVVGGTVFVAGDEEAAPDAPFELRIFALRGGAWHQVADPVAPDPDTEDFELLEGGGNLWLHWVSTPHGPFSFPATVHVARLLR
jgi:hypothetical protein